MSSEEFTLPTSPVKAAFTAPKNMIIFSKPKVGKTTLLSQLKSCLIIDLEDGSDYVEALKVKAKSISDIRKIGEAIIAAKKTLQIYSA